MMRRYRVTQEADYVTGAALHAYRAGYIDAESEEDILRMLNEAPSKRLEYLHTEIDWWRIDDIGFGDHPIEITPAEETEEDKYR